MRYSITHCSSIFELLRIVVRSAIDPYTSAVQLSPWRSVSSCADAATAAERGATERPTDADHLVSVDLPISSSVYGSMRSVAWLDLTTNGSKKRFLLGWGNTGKMARYGREMGWIIRDSDASWRDMRWTESLDLTTNGRKTHRWSVEIH